VLLTTYYKDDEIEEDEMGAECGMYRRELQFIHNNILGREVEGMRSHGRLCCARWCLCVRERG
jgi:hypothetical protein